MPGIKHVDVYHEPGRYGGWPANHGIWSWGDEILVGFSAGYHHDGRSRRGFHAIDPKKPEEHLLARSLDGGETWKTEDPGDAGLWIGAMEGRGNFPHEPDPLVAPKGIDFMHRDFCMTCRMTAPSTTKTSRVYYSYSRGYQWIGPIELPLFDTPGIAARTDYIIIDANICLFLTAMKQDGREGRPFMAESTDGGKDWKFVSWITEEPGGFAIMPSTVRLNDGELLTAIRMRGLRSESHGLCWIATYRSWDDGGSWAPAGHIPVADTGQSGNPGDLLRLEDGRLVLCYGYRRPPYNICATISEDDGRIWLERVVLRRGAGCHDIGYTRSVQREDGKIVTVYYWCDEEESERYIAATIWEA